MDAHNKLIVLAMLVVTVLMRDDRTRTMAIYLHSDIRPLTVTLNSAQVMFCNDTHFCSSRSPSCSDEPITEHLACYCDTLCLVFGDCCQDYEETCLMDYETSATPTTTDSSVVIDLEERLGVPFEIYECNTLSYAAPRQKLGFWVVSKCTGEKDPKCEDPLEFPSLNILDDCFKKMYIPVTSSTTGKAYKNHYCALCNGDIGDVSWSLKIDDTINASKPMGDYPLKYKLYLYTMSYESVTWFPPKHVQSKLIRTCTMYEVTDCQDPSFPDNKEDDCNSVTAYIRTIDPRFGKEFYQKSLCLGCRQNLAYGVVCTRRMPTAINIQGQKETPLEELHLVPISVIIDFTSSTKLVTEEEKQTTIEIQCPDGHVFDPHAKVCIHLSCSEGFVMAIDSCVPESQSRNQYCPEQVQEWSLQFHPDARNSCEDKLYIVFENLREEGIPVDTLRILTSSNDIYHCHYDMLVNASTNLTTSNWTSQDDFIVRVVRVMNDACIILHASMYQPCKHALEERCIGPLQSFPLGLIQLSPTGRKYYFVSETGKWYSENMAVERVTYDNDQEKMRTVFVCDAESILYCQFVSLNQSLFSDVKNGTGEIEYKPAGRVFTQGEFKILETGYIHVCNFFSNEGTKNATSTTTYISFSLNQSIVSTVGCCLSLVALFLTFLTYARFRALRRCVCNKLIMCLCAAIFAGQALLLLGGLANFNIFLCTAVSSLTHYTWLVAFALTFSLAYDLNRTFGSETINRSSENGSKVLFLYLSNSFGTPLLVVIPCLIIQIQKRETVIYARDGICWLSGYVPMLLSFGVPVAITLCLNMVLFTHTVFAIFKTKRLSRKLLLHHLRKPTYTENMKELLIYFKISTLMGFTWVVGFVAAYVKNQVIWYIFVVLNSLQGAFIFLAFMCNVRVWRLWVQGMPTKSMSTSIRKSSNVGADPSANGLPYPCSGRVVIGTIESYDTKREDVITRM